MQYFYYRKDLLHNFQSMNKLKIMYSIFYYCEFCDPNERFNQIINF